MAHTKFWPRVATTVLVALGLNIAVGFAVIWLSSLLENGFLAPPQSWPQEYIVVSLAGEARVMSANYAIGQQRLSYRTLDGKPLDSARVDAISAAVLPDPRQSTWSHWPLSWRERMLWMSDGREYPGVSRWFLVTDPQGALYFEGFAEASRMPLGFIGRAGFRATLPTGDDQFKLRRDPLRTGQIVSLLAGQYYEPRQEFDEHVLPWRAYMLVGQSLVEVDVRTRAVRTVLADLDALSIDVLNKKDAENGELSADQAPSGSVLKKLTTTRLVARLVDRLAIIDPLSGDRTDFLLPEALQTAKGLTVSASAEHEIFVQVGDAYSALERQMSVYRLDQAGKILEQHIVDLAGMPPKDVRAMTAVAAIGIPVPAAWAAMELGAAPYNHMEEGRANTYAEGVRRDVADVWPALVIAAVGGIASAVWMARLQRKYHRPHTAAWCIAALLLGPALVAAYLIDHGAVVMAKCAGCGRTVPRKRDACAACGGAWPAPRTTGAEVFG